MSRRQVFLTRPTTSDWPPCPIEDSSPVPETASPETPPLQKEEPDPFDNLEIPPGIDPVSYKLSVMLGVPTFEYRRVTTMTLVVPLTATPGYIPVPAPDRKEPQVVYPDVAFWFFKVTSIPNPPTRRPGQSIKLDCPGIPGAILSMRYRDRNRGIVRTESEYFLHNIAIDISLDTKNLNLKIGPSMIHICGARSREQGNWGAQLVLDHLSEVQDELDYMNSVPTVAQEVVEWLKRTVVGEETYRWVYWDPASSSESLMKPTTKKCKKYAANLPMTVTLSSGQIIEITDLSQPIGATRDFFLRKRGDSTGETGRGDPTGETGRGDPTGETGRGESSCPDIRIAEFLRRPIADLTYYSDFCDYLAWAVKQTRVIERGTHLAEVMTSMTNYNYSVVGALALGGGVFMKLRKPKSKSD